MSSLKDLIAQRVILDKQIAELRLNARSEAINKALELIAQYELTQQDLFGKTSQKNKVKSVSKVMAKYRDSVTGKEWSGRGVTPKWITESGKDKKEFLIAE